MNWNAREGTRIIWHNVKNFLSLRAHCMFVMEKFEANNMIINVSGLGNGVTEYDCHLDYSFFEEYECTMVLDSDLDVTVEVNKAGMHLGVKCYIRGKIAVPCDRCLEAVDVPMDVDCGVTVKFVKDISAFEDVDDDDIMILPQGEAKVDLRQLIYDTVILNIPMTVVHEDIEDCNPEIVKMLSGPKEVSDEHSNPFGALKDLIKN